MHELYVYQMVCTLIIRSCSTGSNVLCKTTSVTFRILELLICRRSVAHFATECWRQQYLPF